MLPKLLALYGRNLLHHIGALVAGLAPYIVQMSTDKLGWRDSAALSTAVLIAWLLGNAHVSGKLAGTIAQDAAKLLSGPGGGLAAGGGLSSLLPELEGLVGQFFGGGTAPAEAGKYSTSGPPPAGLEGLFPSGAPAAAVVAAATEPPAAPTTPAV